MGPCALALAASAVLGLPLDAPSVAVWVQSSGGIAGLASTLEDALRADARVLTSSDVGVTLGGLATPEPPASELVRIRGDLEVERLLVVAAGRRSGTLTVHLRERDRSASYALVVEARTARETVEDLLRSLPPLPIAHVRIADAGIEPPTCLASGPSATSRARATRRSSWTARRSRGSRGRASRRRSGPSARRAISTCP